MNRVRARGTWQLLSIVSLGCLALGAVPYNLDRALTTQRQMVAERPDEAALQNDLGSLLALAKDFSGAEAAYRRALELDPSSTAARYNLGGLLLRQGERRKALGELRKVVEAKPEDAWAHYQIGAIYLDWHLDPLAKRSFARSFALEPRLADPKFNPHVLDNPLATEAMLAGFVDYEGTVEAPREFSEPERIAALMVEPLVQLTGDPAAEDQFASQNRFEAGEDGEAKVLSAGDLGKGTANQVGGGSAGAASVGRGSSRADIASRMAERRKSLASGEVASEPRSFGNRAVRGAPRAPQETPTDPGDSGDSGGDAPADDPDYEAPRDSTGRLELELLPADGDDTTVAAG